MKRAVHNVGFHIKSHTGERAEFAQIETEYVLDESDDVFGDKTLNERNYADDKSEVARHTQHLMSVAVVNTRALACAEQYVDEQLLDRQMRDIEFDKAVYESADVIAHQSVVQNRGKIELFERVGKSRHEISHIDRVGVNDVNAVALLDSAHIRNKFAFVIIRAEKQSSFAVFSHRTDGVLVDGSAVYFGCQLAEFNEYFAVRIVERIDVPCKASNDKRIGRIFGKAHHECRVNPYVTLVFFRTRFAKSGSLESVPELLRADIRGVVNVRIVRRRRRNDGGVDVPAGFRIARHEAEQHNADQHEQQYER